MARDLKNSNFGQVCRVKGEAPVEGVAADKDYFLVRKGRNNSRIADMVEPGEGILVKTDLITDVRDYTPATEAAPATPVVAAPVTVEVKVEVTAPAAAAVEVTAPVAEAPATQMPAELAETV
jgi:hypothetical protein